MQLFLYVQDMFKSMAICSTTRIFVLADELSSPRHSIPGTYPFHYLILLAGSSLFPVDLLFDLSRSLAKGPFGYLGVACLVYQSYSSSSVQTLTCPQTGLWGGQSCRGLKYVPFCSDCVMLRS